jgi:MFS family permease
MSRSRAAVTVAFGLNGVLFASIFSRLPAIQERTGASDGELGLALLCSMLGLLLSQLGAGALVARWGSRPLVLVGALGYAAALIPVSLAGSVGALAVSFAFVGLMNGVLDVSMNVHGLAVEGHLERPVLASLHAAYSFGALGGAALGGLVASAGVGVEAHLWTMAAIGAVVGVALTRFLLPRGVDAAPEGPSFARPSRALALAGLFAFCVLLSEGAVNDWAAVYLHGELGAAQGPAAAGLAAFSLTMGIGRLAGDRLAERLGSTRLARGGALVATAGMGLALSVGRPAAAVAGFAVMGIGLAALFPLALRAAASSGQVPGPAVAAVSAMGYLGLLTGPPVVGLLSDAVGLRAALVLVVALCATAAVLASAVRAPVRAG